MAVTEVESPVLLGTCTVAGTLILACSAYLKWGAVGTVVVVAASGCVFVLMLRLVRKIQSIDKLAKRFDKRLRALTYGCRGDALGPRSRKPLSVPRQSSSDLPELMEQAAALKDDFERVVVEPLSQYGRTMCNLKGSTSTVRASQQASTSSSIGWSGSRLRHALTSTCRAWARRRSERASSPSAPSVKPQPSRSSSPASSAGSRVLQVDCDRRWSGVGDGLERKVLRGGLGRGGRQCRIESHGD
jgi:hypothetical protein